MTRITPIRPIRHYKASPAPKPGLETDLKTLADAVNEAAKFQSPNAALRRACASG